MNNYRVILSTAISRKPAWFRIPTVTWKYALRSALRERNVLIVGDQGSGKSVLARLVAETLDRPFFTFNMGATQDAESVLIGNTHLDETGTVFRESTFIRALKTPNAVIRLDEITRATHDAWNILFPILDYGQRMVRLAADAQSPEIRVASGVSIFATANIGFEFTATKALDRALTDRFSILEMPTLDAEEEAEVLAHFSPDLSPETCAAIADIAFSARLASRGADPRLSTGISTRMSIEIASLLSDGFSLEEAAEVCIYPFFDDDDPLDSERVYVRQLVQKHLGINLSDTLFDESPYTEACDLF